MSSICRKRSRLTLLLASSVPLRAKTKTGTMARATVGRALLALEAMVPPENLRKNT